MINILITGFEPFGKSTLNPSAEIATRISGVNIITEILPVSYSKAEVRFLELIEIHKPDVVICLGQAEGRSEITPEFVAVNLDDAQISDNEGVQRIGLPIIVDGPDSYYSTLPIEKMVSELKSHGIPASVSHNAGAFLCNHIFYVMQHKFANSQIKSGFIHLPLIDEQAEEFPGLPTMSLEQMVIAVQIMLEAIS